MEKPEIKNIEDFEKVVQLIFEMFVAIAKDVGETRERVLELHNNVNMLDSVIRHWTGSGLTIPAPAPVPLTSVTSTPSIPSPTTNKSTWGSSSGKVPATDGEFYSDLAELKKFLSKSSGNE